jgi:hypothetical protein
MQMRTAPGVGRQIPVSIIMQQNMIAVAFMVNVVSEVVAVTYRYKKSSAENKKEANRYR